VELRSEYSIRDEQETTNKEQGTMNKEQTTTPNHFEGFQPLKGFSQTIFYAARSKNQNVAFS